MNAVTKESQGAMQLAPQSSGAPVATMSSGQMILDVAHMDSMIRLADLMATGKCTLPPAYRNSPGDCLAVVMQSVAWKMNPFAVAQKTHFINGTIGYESQLVHAAITSSGILTKDDFDYEYYGPWEKVIGKFDIRKGDKGEYRVPGWHLADEIGCGVIVTATIRATGKVKVLDLLLAQARTRNSTLWADDPKQQLGYLAVKKWARKFSPGIILGVYTPDELEEANREIRDITPASEQITNSNQSQEAAPDLINQAKSAASKGVAAYQKFWSEAGAPNRKALAAYHDGWKADATAADQARTVDAEPVAGGSKKLTADMEALLIDLQADADAGVEFFAEIWGRLSPETQEVLASEYPKLMARAEAAGAGK